MSPTPTPTARVVLARFAFSVLPFRACVTRYYQVHQGTGTTTDTWALTLDAVVAPLLQACMSGNVTYDGTWIRRVLTSTTDPDAFALGGPYPPGFASGTLPPQVAGLIRLDTDTSKGRHPSKMFIPFVPQEAFDGQSFSAGYTAALDAVGAIQHANIVSTDPATPNAFLRGVHYNRVTLARELITSHTVRGVATQRRRAGVSKTCVALYSPF